MRHQLPAYSPISARGIAAALLTSRDVAIPQLQSLLTNQFEAAAVVLCSSGTHALQLVLAAARRRLGAETTVALPAFTCYDVATAAVAGGQPVMLYDIDPDTLAPDLDSVRAALRAGARIIVASPLYGMPVPWEPLIDLSKEFGAIVIEDAAQGQGALWNGRPLGSLGELSVISFGRGKGWTGGGGGAVLMRGSFGSAEAAEYIPDLPSPAARAPHAARVVAQWLLGRPQIYGIPARMPWLRLAETIYHEPTAPRQLNQSAAQLLLRTAGMLARETATRHRNAAFYAERLQHHAGVRLIAVPAGSVPGYQRFPVRLPAGSSALAQSGAARLGIQPSYPTTLRVLPALQPLLRNREMSCPGADALATQLVTLPVHSFVTEHERDRIVAALLMHSDARNPHLEAVQR